MTHPYTRLYRSATAPTVSNDDTLGYEIGDIIVDQVANRSYQAFDVATGAAVWEELTGSGGGSSDWGDIGGTLSDQADLQAELDDKANLTYVDALLAASDAMVYKGIIDCSANPNYPAADAGHLYKVSVAGKIGGASGPNVEAGDSILCSADGTASGNHATVGAFWGIIQVNIDGAVIGPASAISGHLVVFNGTTGKLISGGGVSIVGLHSLFADITDGVSNGNAHDHTGGDGGAIAYSSLINPPSGTYTPTLTNTTNIDSSTVGGPFTYMRVGNIVIVAGNLTVDPTATGNTVLGISLPIESNFTAVTDGTGNGTSQLNNSAGNLAADATNDRMTLTFQAPVTTSMAFRVVFMYEIK